MRHKIFYRKLFLTYFSIILIYTIVAVTIFFVNVEGFNKKQRNIQKQTYLSQVSDKIDQSLDVAKGLMKQLLSNSDLIQFIINDKLNYLNISRIYDQITYSLAPFDNLGVSIGVGKKNSSLVITSNGTIEEKRFYKAMKFNFDNQDELYEQMNNYTKNDFYTITSSSDYYVNNGKYITLIGGQKFTNNNELIAYLTFYKDIMIPKLKGNEKGALYILSNKDILASRNNGLDESQLNMIEDSLLNNPGIDTININGYKVYSTKSEIIGWNYYYIISDTIHSDLIFEFIKESSIVYIILMIIGTIIAFFVTKKTYEPIYKVMQQFDEDISEEVYDEFEIISRSSNKMRIANEKLKEITLNNRLPLKIKFLRDLLYGLNRNNILDSDLEKHDLIIFNENVNVIVLEYVNIIDLQQKHLEEEIITIRTQIREIINESFKDIKHYQLLQVNNGRDVLIILKKDKDEAKKLMSEILSNVKEQYDIDIIASLGKDVTSITNIGQSFSDALNNLEYRRLVSGMVFIEEDNIKNIKKTTYYYPLDIEQNLINYILIGKKEEAKMVLRHLLDENFNNRNITNEALSLLAFAITGTINRVLNQINKSVEDVYEEGSMVYLELKNSIQNDIFREKVNCMFGTLLENITVCESHENDKLANRILEYIHNNYMMDISLNDIAEYFSITPAYVSMLFKKEHGYNFKDYLNMYRINQAKIIIKQETNIKNVDLATAVGFNSVNTFLRLFKKYEGVSPGKYINKCN
jgi:AraC-like DNA-binding protein